MKLKAYSTGEDEGENEAARSQSSLQVTLYSEQSVTSQETRAQLFQVFEPRKIRIQFLLMKLSFGVFCYTEIENYQELFFFFSWHARRHVTRTEPIKGRMHDPVHPRRGSQVC